MVEAADWTEVAIACLTEGSSSKVENLEKSIDPGCGVDRSLEELEVGFVDVHGTCVVVQTLLLVLAAAFRIVQVFAVAVVVLHLQV